MSLHSGFFRAGPGWLLAALLWAGIGVMVPGAFPQEGPALEAMRADVQSMETESNVGRREAILVMLKARGIDFEIETFDIPLRPNYPRTMGANIVVTVGDGPSDIVVGAHYDAAWLPNGNLSRGAVDNAASAVILTRLAETLRNERLEHRVRVVFFDAEEIGLLGSRDFVQRHRMDPIQAAINLDVNGYGDTVFFGPSSSDGNAPLYEAMNAVCADAAFACREFARYPMSDYISFQRAGIPNLSLSVLPSGEADELWTAYNGTEAEIEALGAPPTVLQVIHSEDDGSAHVDPAGMVHAYHALLGLVRALDAGVANEAAGGDR